jgi:MFS family permease
MVFALEESVWYAPMVEGMNPTTEAASHHIDPSGMAKTASDELEKQITQRTITPETLSASIPLKGYRQRLALATHSPFVKNTNKFPGALYRPFRLLILPAIGIGAIQFAGSILCIAIAATTQGTLYPLAPYYFSAIGIGNMNIPPAIGSLLGAVIGGIAVDKLSMKIARARGGVHEPESRLWLSLFATCASIAGLLMFGLTIAKVRMRDLFLTHRRY